MKLKICLLILAILINSYVFSMEQKDCTLSDETSNTADLSNDNEGFNHAQIDDWTSNRSTFNFRQQNRSNRRRTLTDKANDIVIKFIESSDTLEGVPDDQERNQDQSGDLISDLIDDSERLDYQSQNLHNITHTLRTKTNDLKSDIETTIKSRSTNPNLKQATIIAGALISLIAVSYYFIKKFWFTRENVNKDNANELDNETAQNLKK